jgi:membrane-associated phospholipid phosphatase
MLECSSLPRCDSWPASFRAALSNPDVRLGLGVTGLAVAGLLARRDGIGAGEAAVFRTINQLPDGGYLPSWVVMKFGSLAAVPIAAGLAAATGRSSLAARLTSAGAGTWCVSKLIKASWRRPRPAGALAAVRLRGPMVSGSGFVSGHAGIAVALGAGVLSTAGNPVRLAVVAGICGVGLGRLYVGAHLPLDILGGVALGLGADAVSDRLLNGGRR